ncbi:hypothetical protein [Mucilaginibacter sp.]
MAEHITFRVLVTLPGQREEDLLTILHEQETFDTALNGENISLINNGDNSWSQVQGNLPQETINLIGQAIEDYYSQQPNL